MFTLNAKTFPSLNVGAASLEVTNSAEDKLVVTLKQDITGALPFDPFAQVTLAQDGTTRFIGWFDKPAFSAEGKHQEVSLTLSGPWRWLDRTTFAQTWIDMTTIPPTITTQPMQAPVLNQGTNDSGVLIKLSLATVVKAALDAVIAKHGAVIAYNADEVATLTLEVPWSEKQNVTCASVVRDQLAWLPDRSVWWDYTATPPTLRITKWATPATRQVSETTADTSRLIITPRFDLLARRVTITYIWIYINGVNNQEYRELVVDDSGLVGGTLANTGGADIELTYPLQKNEPPPGMNFTGSAWVQNTSAPFPIAPSYAAAVSRLAVETDFTVVSDTLFWVWVPGETWGFSGVASQWAAYTSQAQRITRDLFSGRMTVHVGPPVHLGLQHLLDLFRKNTPQAGGLGGGGGLSSTPGVINVQMHVSSGDSGDLTDLLSNITVTVTGPNGSVTQDVAGTGLSTFSNLPPGSYTVSVAAGFGWNIDPGVSEDTTVTLGSGETKTANIYMIRITSFTLKTVGGDLITIDAGGGPLVTIQGAAGDTLLISDYDISITNADGTQANISTDGGFIQLIGTDSSQIYLDLDSLDGRYLSIVEMDTCVTGQKVQIVATAPYTP
jgi:hypothetical protein